MTSLFGDSSSSQLEKRVSEEESAPSDNEAEEDVSKSIVAAADLPESFSEAVCVH
jgi:hypothetical protein